MRGWRDLGLVETIYEEDYEPSSSSPASLSPSISSPQTPPLNSRVESWSLATGRKADVSIYVQGTCFRLHKDPLVSRSSYLKRQLMELSEITLPLNIMAETFVLVADFCYGTHIMLTPFNIAALRTAAELLGMTETKSKRDENLKQITETYFHRFIAINRDLALIVFRSCLRLLPEAETTAFLVSRCIDALDLTGEIDEMHIIVDDVLGLNADEFEIVLQAMHCRFTSHDMLYKVVDLNLQQHSGEMTEEQKIDICNFIDCDKLSPQLLIQAVQNPILPLRFIVRAMLIEQLNTRRAIFTASASASASNATTKQQHHHAPQHNHDEEAMITLGTILQRDAAIREAAQLKAEMNSTSSRIEFLEKELAGMKKLLEKTEKERSAMEKKLLLELERDEKEITSVMESKLLQELEIRDETSVIDSSRSASFHYGLRDSKIERGERGSTSFAGFRLQSEKTGDSNINPRTKKNITGMGLISRLKSTLWVSKSASKCHSKNKISIKEDGNGLKVKDDEK